MQIARTALVLFAAAPVFGADVTLPPKTGLTVHEWGTFTSVALPNGAAANWNPLGGTPDLPCFVLRRGLVSEKSLTPFTVRMETPVLYFYSGAPADVAVQVGFDGRLTEWYPQASDNQASGLLRWNLKLTPGADPQYPTTTGASHYYAARNTDATPLRAGDEAEKMVFYRGAGFFQPPATVVFREDGQLELRNRLTTPLPFAALFENRNGKFAFRPLYQVSGALAVAAPEPSDTLDRVKAAMAEALETAGMYPKEAAAMIETWRDSWFEPGMRLFYLTPRHFVDDILPLKLQPEPVALERAFMGRVELMPEWRIAAVETAVASGDVPVLQQEGRFLQTLIGATRRPGHWNLTQSPAAKAFLNALQAQSVEEYQHPGCVK